jgi:hypothetical protein
MSFLRSCFAVVVAVAICTGMGVNRVNADSPKESVTDQARKPQYTGSAVSIADSSYWLDVIYHPAEFYGDFFGGKPKVLVESSPLDKMLKDSTKSPEFFGTAMRVEFRLTHLGGPVLSGLTLEEQVRIEKCNFENPAKPTYRREGVNFGSKNDAGDVIAFGVPKEWLTVITKEEDRSVPFQVIIQELYLHQKNGSSRVIFIFEHTIFPLSGKVQTKVRYNNVLPEEFRQTEAGRAIQKFYSAKRGA